MKTRIAAIMVALGVAATAYSIGAWKITVTTVPAATATRVDTLTISNYVQRTYLVIVNQGDNDAYYGYDNSTHTTNGILLTANGGVRNLEATPHLNEIWIYSELGTTIGCEEGW